MKIQSEKYGDLLKKLTQVIALNAIKMERHSEQLTKLKQIIEIAEKRKE